MRWLCWLAVAGCKGEALAPDAPLPVDAPPFVPGPNVVTLELDNPPLYIRYRDGMGSWTEPVLGTSGYELHITDAYEIAVVCGDEAVGSFDTELHYRTFADGATEVMHCFSPAAAAAPVRATISGQMQQPGEVFFGDLASSQSGPWSFQLQVGLGTHDLIAVGFDGIVVRRDEVVDGPRVLAPIDLVQQGAPLATQTFFVATEPGEIVTSDVVYFTPNGLAFIDGGSDRLRLPPASVMAPGDDLIAGVQATIGDRYRSVRGPPDTGYALLDPLDVTFTFSTLDLFATWHTPPASYDFMNMFLVGSQLAFVSASRRWIDVTGATRFSLYDLPPDFDPRWKGGLGGGYFCDVYAETFDGETLERTGVTKSM